MKIHYWAGFFSMLWADVAQRFGAPWWLIVIMIIVFCLGDWFLEQNAEDLRAEIDTLKRMLVGVNQYTFPGETDSIDSMRKVLDEHRQWKAERAMGVRPLPTVPHIKFDPAKK